MDNDDYIKKLEKEMRKVYIDIGNAENDLEDAERAIMYRDYYAELAYKNARARIKDEYHYGSGSRKERKEKYKKAMDALKTRGRNLVQNEKKAAREDVRKAEDRLNALKEKYASLQAEYEVATKKK